MIVRNVPRANAGARHRVAGVAAVLASLLAACGGDGGSGPGLRTVASVQAFGGSGQTAAVGQLLTDSLTVRVLDGSQRPLDGIPVTWTVESGGGSVTASSRTGSNGTAKAGWRMGTVAGAASLRATAGNLSATFAATVTPGAVATVTVTPATFSIEAGTQRQLQAAAADAHGNAITGRTFTWTTSDAAVATVDGAGLVRGVAAGAATIRGTLDGINGSAAATVTGTTSQAPTITAIAPAMLEPGMTATLTGTNFSATPTANVVTVNNVPATVSSATATELRVVVPGLQALGCLPGGTVNVSVTVGTANVKRAHPLRTATQRTLAPGETATATDAAAFGCIELGANSGRYLVAVYNAANPAPVGGFVPNGPGMRMLVSGPPAASVMAEPITVAPTVTVNAQALQRRIARAAALAERHGQHLRERQRLFAGARALPVANAVEATSSRLAAAPGDTIWIRYPDPTRPSTACATFDSLRARVAHVGTRAVILEDIGVPLPRQVDTLYARMGLEFDNEQYAVVRDNFADPLGRDAQLNNDGKLYMLFTQRVNAFSAAGFVWPGDLLPRSSCAQSNLAEIFYGMVPTVATGGNPNDWTIEDWYWYTRATVVHEVKHIASTVAHIASGAGAGAEEVWLEEATAQVAEELWARGEFGYAQRGNVGSAASVLCEFGVGAGCADRPLVMTNHFAFLYDYMAGADSLSVLGSTNANDHSFYGSAWSFVRYALDQSTTAESALLRSITQSTATGAANLSAAMGRPYAELVRDYALALAADDRAGTVGVDARYSMPSWNLRDIYSGLNALLPDFFPTAFPLAARTMGTSAIDVAQVRPGGVAFFELLVPSTGARAFQVVAPAGGGTLSGDLRVVVMRIQ